jgi:hypothetical protein
MKWNILPLVIYMGHDYSFFGSTVDFVIKKGTFGIFTGLGHLQMSETSDRNMAIELDSRHPKTGKSDFKNKNGNFSRYFVSAFSF